MRNRTLKENLRIDWKSIAYAREKIKISDTDPALKDPQKIAKNFRIVNKMRVEWTMSTEETLFEYFQLPADFNFWYLKKFSKTAKKFQAGNCHEISYSALNYLRKKNVNAEVVYFPPEEGDHYFVVIDRIPGSDINNVKTWGDTCVIADPLKNICYASKDAPKKLSCFRSEGNQNIYYPYTNETMLLERSINNESDREYHLALEKQALKRIDLIQQTLCDFFSVKKDDETYKQLARIKIVIKNYIAQTESRTNNDVERTLNKWVKESLKLASKVPNIDKTQLHMKLIDRFTKILSKSEQHLFKVVTMNSHLGAPSEEVLNMLRKTKQYKW